MLNIQSLGHVVLKVTDKKRSNAFYNGVLGLPICAGGDDTDSAMTFYSLGNHHDFAVMEVAPGSPAIEGPGLHHVAFCLGTDIGLLKDAKAHLEALGIELMPIDHEVTKSLYFEDPDGNGIELYIDASDAWKQEPERVAKIGPLVL